MNFLTPSAKKIDRVFLISSLLIVFAGVLIFSSASLGLLVKDGPNLGHVVFSQLFLGLALGLVGLFACSKINYRVWRKWSFYIFIGALILNLIVFLPRLGLTHGGATRWIEIGGLTFQPSEFLKLAFALYLAAWLSGMREKVKTAKWGLFPLLLILSVIALIIFAQRDTDTFFVMTAAGLIMYLVAGGKLKHLAVIALTGLAVIFVLVISRPYLMTRITTFINPDDNPSGSGYQIQQSLIAIGSGGLSGRGFGQSAQKFILPEPVGDSIFSVAAEEFGFLGSTLLIALFVFFAIRGFKVGARAPDQFGGLIVVGIISMIMVQSFMNMAAMMGIIPLSGMPLIFISHGGTALFVALCEGGIILNVSRYGRLD